MKALREFAKSTLIGGLLVVVPIYFSVLLLAKALAGLVKLFAPITAMLPESLQGLRGPVAVLIVVVLCFAIGLALRTRLGTRLFRAFERRVLEKIPGFGVLRGAVRRVSGRSDDAMFQPVLVEIEEALTPAFIVEELEDGRCVVLVPSVPTPAAGSLYILTRDRVHWVDVPITEAIAVITKWGAGTSKLVNAMRGAGSTPAC
jgi:uncharacterized membrane protein